MDQTLTLTAEQKSFLASVIEFNEHYNNVRAGATQISLVHSFWDELEIADADRLQDDWNVPKWLLPFYGDWHTLIVLNRQNGAIELLDDERRLVFRWPSISEFVNSLSFIGEKPIDTSGIIKSESWLDF